VAGTTHHMSGKYPYERRASVGIGGCRLRVPINLASATIHLDWTAPHLNYQQRIRLHRSIGHLPTQPPTFAMARRRHN
jgi:hypothetical protein